MNRNTPSSHFDLAPQVGVSRSRFNRDSSLKTSFNVGALVPFFLEEVLPGDTFDVKSSKVARLQTLKTPVYDNLYLDTYYFFVPNRLVWEHWQNLMGENTESAWLPTTEYSVPQVTSPASTGWTVGSLADYFGVPTGITNLSINALPFRAYAKIVDDWFRDQNLQDPPVIPTNDSTTTGSNGTNYITDLVAGGAPFTACKFHDYFTSCLPAPQKGPDIQIPLVSRQDNTLPVFTIDGVNDFYAASTETEYQQGIGASFPLYFDTVGTKWKGSPAAPAPAAMIVDTVDDYSGSYGGVSLLKDSSNHEWLPAFNATGLWSGKDNDSLKTTTGFGTPGLTPVNLVAGGLAGNAYMATINELRTAFQIQRLYERDARSGTRYIEVLRSHFGVSSPDARLQRSEYLGGKRMPLNISQVTQLGATTNTSPLGDVAGLSVTTDVNHDFVKSFVEHGFIIGVCVARYDHTYQQGLNRLWSRKSRLDYYWPVLANLGETPVLVKEIYATGTDDDELVFGYQEAWAEYRYKPSIVTSEMRSSYATSLDIWHFGDDYASRPSLSASWIAEDKSNVDRTLAVTSAVSNQVFIDFFIENKATRCMPLYSIPGLIDHN